MKQLTSDIQYYSIALIMKALLMFVFVILSTLLDGYCQTEHRQENSVISKSFDEMPGESWDEIVDRAIRLVDHDNQRALDLLVHCEKIATISSDSACMISSLRLKGQVLVKLGRTHEAIKVFQRALPFARRHGQLYEQLGILVSYGLACSYMSQYDQALQNYFDAREFALKLDDTTYLGLVQNNIGLVYYKLKDYPKALYYWNEASRPETAGRKSTYIRELNMSLAYANMKDFAHAWKILSKTIQSCGDSCADDVALHIQYADGTIQLGLNEVEKAEQAFLASYALSKKVRNVRMVLDNIYNLSDLRRKDNDIAHAVQYLREAEEIIQTGVPFNREIIEIHRRISELYMDLRNYQKAAMYQANYIALKDSIYSEELTNNLMRIESERLEKENLRKLEAQNEILVLNQYIIDRQKTINRLSLLVILIAAGLVIVLYRTYQQKKRINAFLDGKIGERTRELYMSNEQLSKAFYERDLMLHHADTTYKTLATRIEGLYLNALKEVSDPVARTYILKIGALVKNEEKSS